MSYIFLFLLCFQVSIDINFGVRPLFRGEMQEISPMWPGIVAKYGATCAHTGRVACDASWSRLCGRKAPGTPFKTQVWPDRQVTQLVRSYTAHKELHGS